MIIFANDEKRRRAEGIIDLLGREAKNPDELAVKTHWNEVLSARDISDPSVETIYEIMGGAMIESEDKKVKADEDEEDEKPKRRSKR